VTGRGGGAYLVVLLSFIHIRTVEWKAITLAVVLFVRHKAYLLGYGWQTSSTFRTKTSSKNTLCTKRMRWAGLVSLMGEVKNAYNIVVRRPKGKNHSEDLGVDGKIILEWILGKWVVRCGLDASDSR